MLIARSARDTYRFDHDLFNEEGRVSLSDFAAARRFAAQMAAGRGAPVPAGEVNALVLVDEALRLLLQQYMLHNPGVMLRALLRSTPSSGPRPRTRSRPISWMSSRPGQSIPGPNPPRRGSMLPGAATRIGR
jgi:hypothetical protein